MHTATSGADAADQDVAAAQAAALQTDGTLASLLGHRRSPWLPLGITIQGDAGVQMPATVPAGALVELVSMPCRAECAGWTYLIGSAIAAAVPPPWTSPPEDDTDRDLACLAYARAGELSVLQVVHAVFKCHCIHAAESPSETAAMVNFFTEDAEHQYAGVLAYLTYLAEKVHVEHATAAIDAAGHLSQALSGVIPAVRQLPPVLVLASIDAWVWQARASPRAKLALARLQDQVLAAAATAAVTTLVPRSCVYFKPVVHRAADAAMSQTAAAAGAGTLGWASAWPSDHPHFRVYSELHSSATTGTLQGAVGMPIHGQWAYRPFSNRSWPVLESTCWASSAEAGPNPSG